MAEGDKPPLTLIGSGLAGALLAAHLGQAGYELDLYERRPDPHAGNLVGGRSINLALSTRGIDALARIGIADDVLRSAIPMRGRMIHTLGGQTLFQPYDKDPSRCINSIGRGVLNTIALDAARKHPGVRVHFNHRCIDVDLDAPRARLVNTETNEVILSTGRIVIGVDGAYSAVRGSMQKLNRFDYSQSYLHHGYKELTIPPAAGGGFAMEKHALHIWPRHSFMMIALPNPDGSFTCTLFWPFEGPSSFAAVRTDDDVRRFFDAQFPDAVPLMPALLKDFRDNPIGSMVTVRCAPWHHRDKVALVGDACHAVVPFYGQGMNAAFEDCVALTECMERFAPDYGRAFAEYEALRKPNTDALADLAIENFIEMRDKTASRAFHARKKLERTLHKLFPGWYTPLYTMVSFTRIPYAEARRKARAQDQAIVLAAIGLVVVLALLACILVLAT